MLWAGSTEDEVFIGNVPFLLRIALREIEKDHFFIRIYCVQRRIPAKDRLKDTIDDSDLFDNSDFAS